MRRLHRHWCLPTHTAQFKNFWSPDSKSRNREKSLKSSSCTFRVSSSSTRSLMHLPSTATWLMKSRVASWLLTKKALLTQKGTRNSGACLNFESTVKQNQSLESARRPAANYSVLLVLTRGRHLSRLANAVSAKNRRFFPPLSFSALVRGDPLRIYGKALLILKLESSWQPTVKIWWS